MGPDGHVNVLDDSYIVLVMYIIRCITNNLFISFSLFVEYVIMAHKAEKT